MNLFLRSFIFWLYTAITMPPYSILCLISYFFPLTVRHAVVRVYLRSVFVVLKFVCKIDYQVEGLENIPKGKPSIILSKHQSTWETFFLPLIFHNPAIIVKRELLFVPFFGWGLLINQPIAINRHDQKSALEQILSQGKKELAAGRSILVFPEGTRIPYGQVGRYRLGGARLAVATGAPVIPIAHDAGRLWPRRSFIKRPGTVHLFIGPAIETKERTPEEVLAMAKDWIESTIRRIASLVDKPAR